MGLQFFVSRYIYLNDIHMSSLPRHVSETKNFQTWVVSWFLPGVGGRDISLSGGSTPVQKCWSPRFYPGIFNYHMHSPMTAWPKTNGWLNSLRSAARLYALCLPFLFFLLHLSLYCTPHIIWITWTDHITLHSYPSTFWRAPATSEHIYIYIYIYITSDTVSLISTYWFSLYRVHVKTEFTTNYSLT